MHWKWFGKNRLWQNRDSIQELGGAEEKQKVPESVEIRGYFLNMTVEHQGFAKAFVVCCVGERYKSICMNL
jgi:hypothetical protein